MGLLNNHSKQTHLYETWYLEMQNQHHHSLKVGFLQSKHGFYWG